jgi:hypothetical protein
MVIRLPLNSVTPALFFNSVGKMLSILAVIKSTRSNRMKISIKSATVDEVIKVIPNEEKTPLNKDVEPEGNTHASQNKQIMPANVKTITK